LPELLFQHPARSESPGINAPRTPRRARHSHDFLKNAERTHHLIENKARPLHDEPKTNPFRTQSNQEKGPNEPDSNPTEPSWTRPQPSARLIQYHRQRSESRDRRGAPPNPVLFFDLQRLARPRRGSEHAITDWLRKTHEAGAKDRLRLGIGDDCAICRTSASEDQLFTTDMLVEGTHFVRGSHTAADLGRKALARGLSDIAAMGGEPRFCLVSLCVPRWGDQSWVRGFFRGLNTVARKTRTVLAGGDLSHGEHMFCDVTVCGAVPRGAALLRSGARPGDRIFVSGQLGGSALGLKQGAGRAWRRHVRIVPRLEAGLFLRKTLRATSAMDLSDGLSLDLHRLCLASGVGAAIAMPPRFPGASAEQSLHGGEDYELLFTVRPGTSVPTRLGALPLTEIGTIFECRAGGGPGTVLLNGKRLEPLGYDHFRLREQRAASGAVKSLRAETRE